MKKIICLVISLAVLALALCGCGFNYEKEDLTKYVKVADINSLTYAEFEEGYLEYRKELAEQYKNNYFTIQEGYTVDFYVTAETVTEQNTEDGATKTYSYTRYEPWCLETDDKYVSGYEFGKIAANASFDDGLMYSAEDVSSTDDTKRQTKIGEKFAFTYTIPSSYSDSAVAGKKVRFSVTVKDVLPGVTNDGISDMVTSFFTNHSYYRDVIAEGDYVNIDYNAKIDGTSVEKAESAEFKVGSGNSAEALEKALIGHKTSDAFTVDVTFPEDYSNKDVAGKTASVYVKVNSIYNTNATVKENTDFENIWEYKNALRVYYYIRSNIMEKIVGKSEIIEYPQALYTQYEKYYKDDLASDVKSVMEQSNCTEAEAKIQLYGSEAAADEYVKTSTEKSVLEALVTYSLKKTLGIEYTKFDYDSDLLNLTNYLNYYYNDTMTVNQVEAVYTKDILTSQFIFQLCAEKLIETVKISGQPDIS